MLRACVLAILILVAGTAVSAPVEMPVRRTFRPTATAGRPFRVFSYASWNADCTPQPPPVITLRTAPAHGTVSILPGESTIKLVREGSADCTGYVYPGTVVWYTAVEGYKGRDRFDFDVENQTAEPDRRHRHDMVLVTVR